jgi:hypothetical protein
MLPIDGLCARPAELGADKSRGLSNRLQLDTHSVLIVRDDLERQRRGVMQYGNIHHVIIDLKSSAVEIRSATNWLTARSGVLTLPPSFGIWRKKKLFLRKPLGHRASTLVTRKGGGP